MVRTTNKALAVLGIVVAISMALPSKTSAYLVAEEDPEEYWDDFDLSCDVKGISSLESSSSREDMEVGSLDIETLQEEQSPSTSPSMSMPCSDAYSNARGEYSSLTAPCVITFHNENAILVSGVSWNDEDGNHQDPQTHRRKPKSDHRDDEEESGTFSHYYHGTSSVCGIENAILEAKEYVKAWPDECVGDFARCYDLSDTNHIMCPALHELLENRRHRRTLEFAEDHQDDPNEDFLKFDFDKLVPPGTTHISVDCTIDKESFFENLEQQKKFKRQRYREVLHAQKEKTLFAVASILGAVLIAIYAISQMVVQPIVGVMRESIGRNMNNSSNNSSNGNSNHTGYEESDHQFVSLVMPRANSVLRIETESDEFGMQDDIQTIDDVTVTNIDCIPTDYNAVPIAPNRSQSPQQQQQQQQQQQMNVDTASVLPTHMSSQQQPPEPRQIPMDFDAVEIAPATISSPQQEQQQQEYAQSQEIPMDFDVVPIVPATIIPIDAVHAEVVQDGVTYYT